MKTLREWIDGNHPDEKLIYKDGLYRQAEIVERMAAQLLHKVRLDGDTLYKQYKNMIKVISTHTSKSVLLPVYYIAWRGAEFVIRYNFHNWIVSVNSFNQRPDFEGAVNEKEVVSCYAEGFPIEYVFGSYAKNKSQFTCEFEDEYDTMFFFRKVWYSVVKGDIQSHEVIPNIIAACPEKSLNELNMGSPYRKSLKEATSWHYISTLLSLMFRYKKEISVDIKRKVYITAFNCVPEWLSQ